MGTHEKTKEIRRRLEDKLRKNEQLTLRISIQARIKGHREIIEKNGLLGWPSEKEGER